MNATTDGVAGVCSTLVLVIANHILRRAARGRITSVNNAGVGPIALDRGIITASGFLASVIGTFVVIITNDGFSLATRRGITRINRADLGIVTVDSGESAQTGRRAAGVSSALALIITHNGGRRNARAVCRNALPRNTLVGDVRSAVHSGLWVNAFTAITSQRCEHATSSGDTRISCARIAIYASFLGKDTARNFVAGIFRAFVVVVTSNI